MTRKESKKYFDVLSKEQQDLINKVMHTTMDMCSELIDENIVFPEAVAYKVFKWEMLSHMMDNEYYDFKNKTWKKLNDK